MTVQINIPDIGEYSVEVTEILVKVGDIIKEDQSLISVEGEKVSMEIPSPQSGIVKDIKISIGDKVKTGTLIMIFDPIQDKSITQSIKNEIQQTTSNSVVSEEKIYVPDIGNESFEVTEILVKIGDNIIIGQSLLSIEGDKTSIEVPSPCCGIVKDIKVNIGDMVSTGSIIMMCEVNKIKNNSSLGNIKTTAALEKEETKFGLIEENNVNSTYATPAIRRLARKFGVDLTKVKGTGRKGRILIEDIQGYVKKMIDYKQSISTTYSKNNLISDLVPWPKIDFSKFGHIEKVELSHIQKISGANLRRNWMIIPHVTHFDKADITELEKFRKQQNVEVKATSNKDNKITLVVFIMKAVASALKKMPNFNGSLSEDEQYIIIKKYIHLSIAIDTSKGLVVPVIKNVDKKSITELSYELTNFIKKARTGKLTKDDMTGGCFTISSIGNLGTTYFSPIVNAPEAAILGVSKSSIEPSWNEKEFIPRLMLPLSLSFDHRIIDGADGARFLTIIKNNLSDIRRLIM